MIAVETGIAPSTLWEQSWEDILTMIEVLEERARG